MPSSPAGGGRATPWASNFIRQTLNSHKPIVRTGIRKGKTVREVSDSSMGRGVRIIDEEWDANGIPEPITETFPKWGGGSQAITDSPISVDPSNISILSD